MGCGCTGKLASDNSDEPAVVPAVSAERTPLENELPEIPESTPVEVTMPADGGVASLLYMCNESAGSFHS